MHERSICQGIVESVCGAVPESEVLVVTVEIGRLSGVVPEAVRFCFDAAPREMLLRRLGAALAQTMRQVNRLERRVAPGLRRQAAQLRAALDEREREEHSRLSLLLRSRAA